MFSISGLRGLVDKDLTAEIIYKYAAIFGSYIGPGEVIIGRDTRRSGVLYTQAVMQGLSSVGCKVVDLGIVPTPTVLFIVEKRRAKGGIAVTASHNPIEWNALKFVSSKGRFLNKHEFLDFLKQTKKSTLVSKSRKELNKTRKLKNAIKMHIDRIVNVIRPVEEGLSVGVDAVNGAGSIALPKVLEMMGCQVSRLNCRFSHHFPRLPEPRPGNITGLCRLVKEKGLDLGVACDPDCDRLALVDEKGRAIGEDKTIVLATDFLLEKKAGSIVTNFSTTALMDDIAKKYHCSIYRTKVGEANVVSKMIKMSAIVGGEGNGGVIYPTINFTRDALVAAAVIVKLIVERKQKLSQIVEQYPEYYMQKQKIRISRKKFESKKERLTCAIKGKVSYADGIKITKKDTWLHIRPSQTEPFLRIIGEAKDKEQLKGYIRKIKDILS
jgi:phosphomannomutase